VQPGKSSWILVHCTTEKLNDYWYFTFDAKKIGQQTLKNTRNLHYFNSPLHIHLTRNTNCWDVPTSITSRYHRLSPASWHLLFTGETVSSVIALYACNSSKQVSESLILHVQLCHQFPDLLLFLCQCMKTLHNFQCVTFRYGIIFTNNLTGHLQVWEFKTTGAKQFWMMLVLTLCANCRQ
jgi:hypothetical protein